MLRRDGASKVLYRGKQMGANRLAAFLKSTHGYPVGLENIQVQVAIANVTVPNDFQIGVLLGN